MKKKKGFIFVETIVVLVVVALSLSIALSSYSLVTRRTKINYYYNNASDLFLLNYLFTMGTTASSNYLNVSSAVFEKRANCSSVVTKMTNCTTVLSNFDVEYIGIIPDVNVALNNSTLTAKMDGGVIEFLNQLRKCTDNKTCTGTYTPIPYAIGVFYRNEKYHYAAIVIEKGV